MKEAEQIQEPVLALMAMRTLKKNARSKGQQKVTLGMMKKGM